MNSLQGIRVLDLSRVLAGPWCTQTLADLGADVIKIERPGTGDDTRAWGPPFLQDGKGRDTQEAAYYLGCNRNKRSVTCDIASGEGQSLIRELAKYCDVLVENFKVGDLQRYGLGWDDIRKVNPRLVYASITGERDDLGGGPQKVGVAVADLFTGMYTTVAILAALRHAEKTGEGQRIDMALLDTQVAMLANLGANYLVSGSVPGRAGNAHQNIVPYQVFETAPGAGGRDFLILAVGNDPQFAKFCEAAGRADIAADPRFARNQERVRNRGVLVPLLEDVMKTRTKAEWLRALEAAKVPCGPINNLAEVFADPQVNERGMVDHWKHPARDELRLVASPIKMSGTPVRKDFPPPLLGQHTDEVLRDVLGWDDARVAAARKQGTV
jgi:crotonobetainyl-CoA:carnitine CoA-transferase CaiB-like acyl-CoA transferase